MNTTKKRLPAVPAKYQRATLSIPNNMPAPHELRSPEGNARPAFPRWKWSRLGELQLRNANVVQKLTNGCGPTSRIRRAGLTVRSVFLNWRRAQKTACFIAIATIVHPAQSQQAKLAESYVAAANRAVQSRLPFGDRQDFEDAMRGFIATTPDAGNPDRYAFLKQEAPPTVNPSLWRQAQLNATNGLFQVTDGVYQVRGFAQANMTIVEGMTGCHRHRHALFTRRSARSSRPLFCASSTQASRRCNLQPQSPDHYGGASGVGLASRRGFRKNEDHCAGGLYGSPHRRSRYRRKRKGAARAVSVWSAAAAWRTWKRRSRPWQERLSGRERARVDCRTKRYHSAADGDPHYRWSSSHISTCSGIRSTFRDADLLAAVVCPGCGRGCPFTLCTICSHFAAP